MKTDTGRVRDYYAKFDEWGRLGSASGQLVFDRTVALLEQYLPPASLVLDLGGGPGRYAIELARKGHRVSLCDLSDELLKRAREEITAAGVVIESVEQVDAVDLSVYPDSSFDAVLAMGPFYHLMLADERTAAAGEIARVTRDGGMVFVDFIPRLTGVKWLIDRWATDPEQVTDRAFAEACRSGAFRNGSPRGFQEGYYADSVSGIS